MKIFHKLNHILFATLGGKIFMSAFAGVGILSFAVSLARYDYAYNLVKEARQKAEIAEQKWYGKTLSRDVVYKHYPNIRGKDYVENLYTGEKTVEDLEWVRPICSIIDAPDSLAVFSRFEKGRGSRKGYLNIYTGEVVIPDIFKHAWNFKNGKHAVVCLENDSLYVIDRSGNFKSKGFKSSTQLKFGFVFNDGLCIMENNNGKFGLINPHGEWSLNPEYEWITRNPRTGTYKVRKDGLFGVIDSDLSVVLPIKFKDIDFNEPLNDPNMERDWYYKVGYWVEHTDGTRGYYDENGQLISTSPYSELRPLEYNWHKDKSGELHQTTSDYIAYRVGQKWGLMSRRGQIITKPLYDWLRAIDSDRFEATLDKDVKIIIGPSGEEII